MKLLLIFFLTFELYFTGFSVKLKYFNDFSKVKYLNFYWKTRKIKLKVRKNINNIIIINTKYQIMPKNKTSKKFELFWKALI